ncbi:hypothetical protein [Natranaerobius trueperi]|uniref:hypothetical protein n=1 Tax=Natranaerobius trueperi TaxID=759412 RepID=UPI00146F2C65|nr:hypothetical protein [Natranaerobius trueperi]
MTKKVTYQMTQQEIKKLNIINQIIDGYLTIKDAVWKKQNKRTDMNFDLDDQELLDAILNSRDRV